MKRNKNNSLIKETETVKDAAIPAKSTKKERRKPLSFLLPILAAVCVLLAGYTFVHVMMDNGMFEETHYIFQSDAINETVRTVVLADLHLHEFGEDNAVLLERVAALEPDFISIVGDMFLYGSNEYEPMYSLCEKLCAIAPVYFALGNHEMAEILKNKEDIKGRLAQCGVTVLSNSTIEAEYKGNHLVIGGLTQSKDEIERYAPNFMDSFMEHEGFHLLLTHYPANFDGYIENYPVDLALSGHEHGGVVRFPLIGALYTPQQGLFPKLTEGMLKAGNSTVIISRGLGDSGVIPRVNNRRELVVVDITNNKFKFN